MNVVKQGAFPKAVLHHMSISKTSITKCSSPKEDTFIPFFPLYDAKMQLTWENKRC